MVITVPSEKVSRTIKAEHGTEWDVRFRAVLPGEARDGWRMDGTAGVVARAQCEIVAVRGFEGVRVGGKLLAPTDRAALEHVLRAFPDLADEVAVEAVALGKVVEGERSNSPGALASQPS